jgi:hypothetical protein
MFKILNIYKCYGSKILKEDIVDNFLASSIIQLSQKEPLFIPDNSKSLTNRVITNSSNENINDIEEASERLKDDLLPYEMNDLNSWEDKIVIYTFASAQTLQKVTKTDIAHKCSAALTVRFPDKRQNNMYKTDNTANIQVLQILQEMRQDMNIQREKIASLEAEIQNDDDDDDDNDDNPIIGALKKNPELMNNLINGAVIALGSIFKKSTPVATALGSINNDDDNKLLNSLEILKANDDNLADHLEILANMSIENPTQFKMLIGMLK